MAHHQVDRFAEQTSVPYHRRRQEQNARVLDSQLRRQIANTAIQESTRESLALQLRIATRTHTTAFQKQKKQAHAHAEIRIKISLHLIFANLASKRFVMFLVNNSKLRK